MPSSHKKPKTKTDKFPCHKCEKTFNYNKDLQHHKGHHHADQASAWVITMKRREAEAKAKRALKPKTRFDCDECEKTFSEKQNLEGHRLRFHTDQNDPEVIAYRTEQKKRRKQHDRKVKETDVDSGFARGSADAVTSSSASVEVASASSPLGGAAARCEKSGCDEVFKSSQHKVQHSVDRVGVNMRISRLSSPSMSVPKLGLPSLGLPSLGLPSLV